MSSRRVRPSATTARQVKSIIMAAKEDKYFNCRGDLIKAIQPPSTGNTSTLGVAAFATTGINQANTGTPITYCGRQVTDLNMLKPFNSSSAAAYTNNAIDGYEAVPTLSRTQWQIMRTAVNLGDNGNNPIPFDAELFTTLPIRCRVMRVTPKLQAGIATSIDPTNDLFLNQYGVEYGANDNAFTVTDAEYAVLNSRKYTILGDDRFTLETPPATQENTLDTSTTSTAAVFRAPGSSIKRMQIDHQLAAKKGGSVRYELPDDNATTNATEGHRREYIFFHFWWLCDDGFISSSVSRPPSWTTQGSPQDIVVHGRVVSKFKDV